MVRGQGRENRHSSYYGEDSNRPLSQRDIAKGQSLCRKLTANPILTGIGVEGEWDFGSKEGIRPIISPAR